MGKGPKKICEDETMGLELPVHERERTTNEYRVPLEFRSILCRIWPRSEPNSPYTIVFFNGILRYQFNSVTSKNASKSKGKETCGPTTSSTASRTLAPIVSQPLFNNHQLKVKYFLSKSFLSSSFSQTFPVGIPKALSKSLSSCVCSADDVIDEESGSDERTEET